ncbi:Plant transposon protein [Fragilaria crotonensis]|nr:Plant transposon protein [Fragilaria crotonensis]
MNQFLDPDELRPKTILACMSPNGLIDISKFVRYQRYMVDCCRDLLVDEVVPPSAQPSSTTPLQQPATRKRGRTNVCEYIDADGQLHRLTPFKSNWYLLYILHPATTQRTFQKKFRRRFRLPFLQFLELLAESKEKNWFPRWTSRDACGKPSSPLALMILGALRYLGRGWTFDDIEESTGIDEETHRQFFHCFIEVGSSHLFKKYVLQPLTLTDAHNHMREMQIAGFPGCIGSCDATHVLIEKCSNRLKNQHTAKKLPGTARTYNVTVNHRRRILSTTTGHPCRWNDKTLILFDKFARGLQNGNNPLNDVEFTLCERNENGSVIEVRYRGSYLLVDNGYLRWSTTIPPTKSPLTQKEQRWSQWLESMRKDVECTFGIMKGRWRILKTGIRLHGVSQPDKVWLTCCALHNWLLEVDGLDEHWENGVASDWEGELGMHSAEDALLLASRPSSQQPFAMQRLNSRQIRQYDSSGIGPGPGQVSQQVRDAAGPDPNANADIIGATENGARVVRKLPQAYFIKKLVEHFDIMWLRNDIVWPRRLKTPAVENPTGVR